MGLASQNCISGFASIPRKLVNETISLPWNRASLVRVFPVSITKFMNFGK